MNHPLINKTNLAYEKIIALTYKYPNNTKLDTIDELEDILRNVYSNNDIEKHIVYHFLYIIEKEEYKVNSITYWLYRSVVRALVKKIEGFESATHNEFDSIVRHVRSLLKPQYYSTEYHTLRYMSVLYNTEQDLNNKFKYSQPLNTFTNCLIAVREYLWDHNKSLKFYEFLRLLCNTIIYELTKMPPIDKYY